MNGINTHLPLDPELVARLDIPRDLVHLALAGVHDDIVIVRLGDGADAVLEPTESSKEVVPGLVAVVLGLGVAMEQLLEGQRRAGRGVCDLLEGLDTVWGEPGLDVGAEDGG